MNATAIADAPSFGRRRGGPDEVVTPAAPPVLSADPTPTPDAARGPAGELRALALARLDPGAVATMESDALTAEVERVIADLGDQQRIVLSAREQRELAAELVDDMLGLGPLAPLLEDEAITDIMVNGPWRVFIERRGKVTLSNVRFRDSTHLSNIAQRIAAAIGRRIDESSPMVDARLADGSRVNIVFPPLALDGPCVSIRKFARRKLDFGRMVEIGTMGRPIARALEVAARCRLNILVSGSTGSGKTTMLNALSSLIDHGERIVTIEDAAELQLQQPHVVRLETRPPNLEGRGEVTQRDLVKNALRMRPDRIILGEVRGPEAFDLLQAMNTGHDGSMGTVHANSARDAIVRLENLVMMGQGNLPPKAIRTQIVAALDLIVQVERMRDGTRRVTQVTEVCGLEGEVPVLNDAFRFEYMGEGTDGRVRARWRVTTARPGFAPRLAYFGLDRAWMAAMDEGTAEDLALGGDPP